MRYLTDAIEQDLKKKMVFLSGPRQCGKTTLARAILKKGSGTYFNWDNEEDRAALLARQWKKTDKLLVFDELHKRPKWKQWIKGEYDVHKDVHRYLVTGSAMLDVYRRGGDSLLGRYHHWRLHPFTMDERPTKMTPQEGFHRLMKVGGFPEPFLDGDEREARRWRTERHHRVLKEDIRDLEAVRNIAGMGLLLEMLKQRVGGMVVMANLAHELQISPLTVKLWIEILERMYVVFAVRPLVKGVGRAIVKPPKLYFYDTGDVVGDAGAKYENLVATHLQKWCNFYEDRDGYTYRLHYLRDKDGHEVDFAITCDGVLKAIIEAKYSDSSPSASLKYFAERLQPMVTEQWVAEMPHDKRHHHDLVFSATQVLQHPERVFGSA